MTAPEIFLHNWIESFELETAYSTDIVPSAYTIAEDRRALLGIPRRTLTFRWSAMKLDELNRMILRLMRSTIAQMLIPLYADVAVVTSVTNTGTSVLHCDAEGKRYFIGQDVVIFSVSADGRPSVKEQGTVQAADDTSVTITTTLVNNFNNKLTFIMPLILCEIALSNDLSLITDYYGEVAMSFQEVNRKEALPPTVDAETLVAGFQTSDEYITGQDRMIFAPDPNWSQSPFKRSIVRAGSKFAQGRGEVVSGLGARGLYEFELPFLFSKRADFWSMLQFFDAVRGRLIPFWVVAPNSMWTITAIDQIFGLHIDIVKSGELADLQDFIEFVALVMVDGTIYIRRATWTDTGTHYRATFVTQLPSLMAVSDVSRATHAVLSRFAQDALSETWTTDGICEITVRTHEVIDEKCHGMTLVVPLATGDGATTSWSGFADPPIDPHHSPIPGPYPLDEAFVTFHYTIAGVTYDVQGTFDGTWVQLAGPHLIAGFAKFKRTTGEWHLHFDTAPDDGTPVTATIVGC